MPAGWTQGCGGARPNYHREIVSGPLRLRLDVWQVDESGAQWGYSVQWSNAEPGATPHPSAMRAMAAAESVLADYLRAAARQCKQQ